MGHPLTPDLSKLTTEELTNKYNELTKRLNYAFRIGQGDMVGQLHLFIQDYQEELNNRSQKALAELEAKSKTFKNIIDIQ
jgi:ribosomal protein L29